MLHSLCIFLYNFVYLLISIQLTANELRREIKTLQAALDRARAHEVKLTSQFQVCLHCLQDVSPLNLFN